MRVEEEWVERKRVPGGPGRVKYRGTDSFAQLCSRCLRNGRRVQMFHHRKYLHQVEIVLECPACGWSVAIGRTRHMPMEKMDKLLTLQREMNRLSEKAYITSYTLKPPRV